MVLSKDNEIESLKNKELHKNLLNCILPNQFLNGQSAVDSYFNYKLFLLRKRDFELNVKETDVAKDMKRRFNRLVALINVFEHDLILKNNIDFDTAEKLVKEITLIAIKHDNNMEMRMKDTRCKKEGHALKVHQFNHYYRSLITDARKFFKRKGIMIGLKLNNFPYLNKLSIQSCMGVIPEDYDQDIFIKKQRKRKKLIINHINEWFSFLSILRR